MHDCELEIRNNNNIIINKMIVNPKHNLLIAIIIIVNEKMGKYTLLIIMNIGTISGKVNITKGLFKLKLR